MTFPLQEDLPESILSGSIPTVTSERQGSLKSRIAVILEDAMMQETPSGEFPAWPLNPD
jgi:hypothetical protein